MNKVFFKLASLWLAGYAGWGAWQLSTHIGREAGFRAYAQLGLIWLLTLWLLGFIVREILRYRQRRKGHYDQEDVEDSFRRVVPDKGIKLKNLRPQQVVENGRATYYFFVEVKGRAQRRWPRKKQELLRALSRPWSRQEWMGILIVGVGEAAIIGFSWIAPRYQLSPRNSVLVSAGAILLANLLILLLWVAGDDDEGGERPPRPGIPPATGRLILRTAKSTEYARKEVSQQ